MDQEDLGREQEIPELCKAAAQIKAGNKMLVREVKELAPPPEKIDSKLLLHKALEMESKISNGDYRGAANSLDQAMDPLLGLKGTKGLNSGYSRLFFFLLFAAGISILLLFLLRI